MLSITYTKRDTDDNKTVISMKTDYLFEEKILSISSEDTFDKIWGKSFIITIYYEEGIIYSYRYDNKTERDELLDYVTKSIEAYHLLKNKNSDKEEIPSFVEVMTKISDRKAKEQKTVSISELHLPLKYFRLLTRAGIHTIPELLNKSYQELIYIRGLGKITVSEMAAMVCNKGYSFMDEKINVVGQEFLKIKKGKINE